MTRKKKLLRLGIAAALVLAVYLSMRPGAPKHNIDRASFEKIRKDMTLAEVATVLGVPAGDYTTKPSTNECDSQSAHSEWISDEGVISVWIDEKGRILEARFSPVSPRTDLTWLDRLQIWLGLREKTLRRESFITDW